MSEPFVGEIRMFGGNFAPRGWAFCDGQLLAVSQNDALFSLLGTIYGGDGRTTFALPDIRGRVPIHAGHGPGLSEYRLGQKGGQENVTLTANQLPSHTHTPAASNVLTEATESTPVNHFPASDSGGHLDYRTENDSDMANAIEYTGGSRSHTNLMPALCVNFIIALFGIYPSRY